MIIGNVGVQQTDDNNVEVTDTQIGMSVFQTEKHWLHKNVFLF